MTLRSLTLLAALLFAEILWSLIPPLRGWWPHLTVAWVVFAAARVEGGPLLVVAAAIGLAEDVVFGSPFGVHALGLVAVAAAARQWRHHLAPEQRLNIAVYVFLYAVAETALLGFIIGGPAGLWHGLSLRGALVTALAAVIMPRRVDRLFRPPHAAIGADVRLAPVK